MRTFFTLDFHMVEIEGERFFLRPLLAKQARLLSFDILAILSRGDNAQTAPASIGLKVIQDALGSPALAPTVEKMISTFGANTEIENEKGQRVTLSAELADYVFCQRLSLLTLWLLECLKLNYSDFLAMFQKLANKAEAGNK